MDAWNREEWGAILLGFLMVFIGMGILVVGMLPAWVGFIALLIAIGVPLVVVLATRRLLVHH